MHLPVSLLAVVQSLLLSVYAQEQQLVTERVLDIFTSALPNPPVYRIPPSTDPLFVSVALCANSDNSTRFFLTNDTSISNPGPSDVDPPNTIEVVVQETGFGLWSLSFPNGGVLSVMKGNQPVEIQMLVSATNSTVGHPLVGDTTSNQALVFSPSFNPVPLQQPNFPNYTLSPANLTFPPEPSSPVNYTLLVAPASQSNLTSLPRTVCALRAAAPGNRGTLLPHETSEGLWLRDSRGWRWQWIVNGLTPHTNYTVFALRDGQLASSAPVYMYTKSAAFNCPIVHSLPYCPSVAYAAPLVPPDGAASTHTGATIPDAVTDTLLSVLSNFTTTLSTLACGRDTYSPLVTCADCQAAYRRWLCAVSFPRCSEPPSNETIAAWEAAANASSSANKGHGKDDWDWDKNGIKDSAQIPLPALQTVTAGSTQRNPVLPAFGSDYQSLLPCLETCNAADRACPSFLGFKCPRPQFTAGSSYGVGYVDSGEDGVMGKGRPGVAHDPWGNVWCNMG
ncbi:stretch-activated cation channel Mid1 [Trametes elegans]|nr:stretch-activated cation channel Mid1 [Trametes elegans]